jgi:hypothetical protein
VFTDSQGRFELTAIPGKYNLSVSDTALGSYVQTRLVSQPVNVVRANSTTVHVEMAPLSDVLNDLCHDTRRYDGEVVLLGRVYAPDRARLRNASVTGTWASYYTVGGGIEAKTTRHDSDVDDEGHFVVCGAPVQRPVKLRVAVGKNVLADTTLLIDKPTITQPVEWKLPPLDRQP